MEKIWLKNYPPSIPPEIDVNEYQSVAEVFAKSAAKFSDRPAFTNMGKTLSYQEIDEFTRHFAAYLQSLGLKKGDRVAIMLPNVLQNPISIFGVLRAGLIVVNVNPLYTPRELEYQLNDSGAETIIILENFAHVLEKVITHTSIKHVIMTQLGDMLNFPKSAIVNFVVKHIKKMVPIWKLPQTTCFKAALQQGRQLSLTPVSLNHEAVAFLQYTGGTTGISKAAMLTHGNIVANLQQASAWIKPFIGEGTEVLITALPLYHIFSLTANCLVFSKAGALNVLITNPKDIPGFVKELSNYQFTAITGVNTLFNALLNHPDFAKLDFSKLHLTLGGGMAVQKAVAERWKKITGCTLVEAYGLTETSPAATINPLDLKEYNGTIGLPISSTEVSVRDAEGQELPLGEVGELCIRGPQVMKGYWNRPDETAKVFTEDGFFKTGDIAVIEEGGFVKIVDRLKDMILVSGFNVYPNEVENVVAMHPGVLEVAAIGIPDEKSGEAVKLFIVKKDPNLTEEAVLEHCRANLTGYKIPKIIEFRTELPKTNVGKILRRALRDEAKIAA